MVAAGDLYAVGLYEWRVDGATPIMGNAHVGFFDPARGGFLPGAVDLGIAGDPSGVIGRLVVGGDGERLYALLTWAGAIVELTRVTSAAP
jgi:hypothetical protein